MNLALVLAGVAMGAAASPHCALMCGAPCAALTKGCRSEGTGFHAGRVIGYMAGGAVAAASVQTLAAWSQAAPAIRPLWLLLQLAFVALGLWWLITGRPPRAMMRDVLPTVRFIGRSTPVARASLAGLAWVAWPCGALQAALLVAALAGDAMGGALVMGAFALASMPALMIAPWAWSRLKAAGGITMSAQAVTATSYRIAGAGLVLAAGWSVTHGMWERVAAWCGV